MLGGSAVSGQAPAPLFKARSPIWQGISTASIAQTMAQAILPAQCFFARGDSATVSRRGSWCYSSGADEGCARRRRASSSGLSRRWLT